MSLKPHIKMRFYIVMELQGFWILGLVRVIYEAIKNVVLNAQMEKRLRGA